jgi:hypothetical protein
MGSVNGSAGQAWDHRMNQLVGHRSDNASADCHRLSASATVTELKSINRADFPPVEIQLFLISLRNTSKSPDIHTQCKD